MRNLQSAFFTSVCLLLAMSCSSDFPLQSTWFGKQMESIDSTNNITNPSNNQNSGSAPSLTITSSPKYVSESAFNNRVNAILNSSNADSVAKFIFDTLSINDFLVTGDSATPVWDGDLFDVARNRWVIGDGKYSSQCSADTCHATYSTKYYYGRSGYLALRFYVLLGPTIYYKPN